MHGASNPIASGTEYQHIIFDQLFNDRDMGFIMAGSGIVATNDPSHTTDSSIDDIII
jgi:hypothetical protein